ncbi:MAG TPA: RluA family pseudouridine synthase [Syntrophobacteraceae bacterium]|nr:RluA family pseudouridine synthase [Syntrophobacteraceae bacterium]
MAVGTEDAHIPTAWTDEELQGPPDLVFRIQAESTGHRLDVFLNQRYPDLSRSHFKKLIENHRVRLNQRITKPSSELKEGDQVEVWLPTGPSAGELAPEPIPLDILHEDDHILVLNKTPGMVVHPGPGHANGTLVHALLAHCPRLAIQGAPLRPGIVHRLDQHTSGVMVIAKSEVAYLDLIRQFKEHTVAKEYVALVYGHVTPPQGEIITLMDRHPTDRKKMAVVQGKGREAVSRWKVEKSWGEVTLLQVRIETGRTHQIRVHLSHIHHPVVGDAVYGGGMRRAKAVKSMEIRTIVASAQRQMLHAYRISIQHPVTRERLHFEAQLPEDFRAVIRALDHCPTMP